MQWHDHSNWIFDEHSFLSPSKKTWVNYDDETLIKNYKSYLTQPKLGTAVHDLANRLILKEHKLNKTEWCLVAWDLEDIYGLPKFAISKSLIFENLRLFVNDSITYKCQTEQRLIYTPHAFGKADAIQLIDNTLYIFDLKTGANPADIDQLISYAALFCLEYNVKPSNLKFDLRLYQYDSIITDPNITPEVVEARMKVYVHHNDILNKVDGGLL